MSEYSSGSTDKAIGFAIVFGSAAVMSAVAMAVFGVQYLGGTSSAQVAGSYAFAGAVVFAMLSVFALQWWDQ